MRKWKCTVCGYVHEGDAPPDICPVCGAGSDAFVEVDQDGKEIAPPLKTTAASEVEESKRRWKCTVCGYIHEGPQPPDTCPVCGAGSEAFVEVDDDGNEIASAQTPPAAPAVEDSRRRWKCTVCGYIHEGAQPPEICPVCGADRSLFVEVDPDGKDITAAKDPTASAAADQDTTPIPTAAVAPEREPEPQRGGLYQRISDLSVRLHGHPIAVHIPNGVLPVAVIFLILGMAMGNSLLVKTAFLNLCFVALSMPVVLLTGYIEWQARFGGNMTSVFKTKIICGAVVTGLSWLLVVWHLMNPYAAASWSGERWIYLVLHLIMLAAAGLAGYMGGKLIIFPGDK